MAIDFKKGADFLKNATNKVGEAGKNVANATKEGVQALSDKAQEWSAQTKAKQLEEMLKKFPPIFREQYDKGEFEKPQLIQIVDNSLKQELAEYAGALGWSDKEDGVEVMHLYSASVTDSKLRFVPTVACDALYCAHPFDQNCYIRIDSYFSYIQQAKLAELQHIAFTLGVKHYWVELVETSNQAESSKRAISLSGLKMATGSTEQNMQSQTYVQSKSLAEMQFAESREPQVPELHYFAQDENLKELIAMRCSGETKGMLTSYTIELSNSSSAAISASIAAKISVAANKMGAGSSFQTQSAREQNSKMIFKMEF